MKARWNYCRSSDVWVPRCLGLLWVERRRPLERQLPRHHPGLVVLESSLSLCIELIRARIPITPGKPVGCPVAGERPWELTLLWPARLLVEDRGVCMGIQQHRMAILIAALVGTLESRLENTGVSVVRRLPVRARVRTVLVRVCLLPQPLRFLCIVIRTNPTSTRCTWTQECRLSIAFLVCAVTDLVGILLAERI